MEVGLKTGSLILELGAVQAIQVATQGTRNSAVAVPGGDSHVGSIYELPLSPQVTAERSFLCGLLDHFIELR